MNDAGFWFLLLAMKLPIFLMFYIVFKAINSEPEGQGGSDDGGGGSRKRHFPVYPRRGPRGGGTIAPPPRVRRPARTLPERERLEV